MILFWDTETTGFFDDRLPVDHDAQPYIVQLAAQLCQDDGAPVSGFSLIVDPGISNGIFIPEKAAAVHGITNERAVQLGCSSQFALSAFTHLYQRADIICAHNAKFDKGVTEAAISRHYGRVMPLRKPVFCTMDAASPIINLPPTERMLAAGFTKPKPPKLEECIRHFFNEELEGAHDAMVDVNACRRVYFHLKTLGAAS
ncbi:3'-5' exonuclease [Roseixanthobacter pseudopolyaromaticivorans]|uniref:3'-5' exonuclease n=1 Tax=Xanthobacteraceae TaxID=335928 RepID=UPI003727C81B